MLLITFGLLMIIEDVMKLLFGGTPLSAGAIMDTMGSMRIGACSIRSYNLIVIGVGVVAAIGLWWFIYRTRFGVILRATSQDRRMASALGLNVGRVYVQAFAHRLLHGGARRGSGRAGAGRRARHGRRCADPGIRRGRHRRSRQPGGRWLAH